MSKPYVINDETNNDELFPAGLARGLDLGLRDDRGYEGVARPYPDSLLIPESEWRARIEERIARKATTRERMTRAGVKVKNQARTNFCWVFAPTSALEIARINQGLDHVELSPASVGAPMKNYRNVGGWGREALERIISHGAVPHSLWPSTAIDPRYDTPATRAEAAKNKVDEWWVLPNRSKKHLCSAILRGLTVPIGLNWWGHEVLAVDLVIVDGEVCPLILNSWDVTWGDQGFGVLQGGKMLPDDCVAPCSSIIA